MVRMSSLAVQVGSLGPFRGVAASRKVETTCCARGWEFQVNLATDLVSMSPLSRERSQTLDALSGCPRGEIDARIDARYRARANEGFRERTEIRVAPESSLRRHRAPVTPLIRHGGLVIDSLPRRRFLPSLQR